MSISLNVFFGKYTLTYYTLLCLIVWGKVGNFCSLKEKLSFKAFNYYEIWIIYLTPQLIIKRVVLIGINTFLASKI